LTAAGLVQAHAPLAALLLAARAAG